MLVVLPFCAREERIAFNLLQWIAELGNVSRHDILIQVPSSVSAATAERAMAIARPVFKTATLYHLTDDCVGLPFPFPHNFTWKRAVTYIDHFKLWPFLFMEPDAVPLSADWLNRIEDEYVKSGKPFMGYLERAGQEGQHQNGVGVYGDIMHLAPGSMSAPVPQSADNVGKNFMAFDLAGAEEIVPQMHVSRLFQFQYKKEETLLRDETLSFLNPDAVLFHTEKTGKLIDLLRARRGGVAASVPAQAGDEGVSGVFPPSLTPPRRGLTTDIFIKTWSGDAIWHGYCLKSIETFATGFRNTVELSEVADGRTPGYLWQQVCKMNADEYSDADYILVTDSDTLFMRPVTPETYMRDGKTIWTYRSLKAAVVKDGAGILAWKQCMTDFMGIEPENEFMERHPEMIPRWLLQAFRAFCWQRHKCSVESYVMRQEQFSEWNVLGFYAWTYHRESFAWINTDVEIHPMTVKQFWTGPHNQTLEQRHERARKHLPEMEAILNAGVAQLEEQEPPKLPVVSSILTARAAKKRGKPAKKKRNLSPEARENARARMVAYHAAKRKAVA